MGEEATPRCPFCEGSGFANGRMCLCPVGWAWRASPRVTIGDKTYVFPPGTTMEQAQSVIDEAKRIAIDGLS